MRPGSCVSIELHKQITARSPPRSGACARIGPPGRGACATTPAFRGICAAKPQTPVPDASGACATIPVYRGTDGPRPTSAPYRHLALGVIRVRDGQIVHYDDYMDPIAVARLLGRTRELATALASAGPVQDRAGQAGLP